MIYSPREHSKKDKITFKKRVEKAPVDYIGDEDLWKVI